MKSFCGFLFLFAFSLPFAQAEELNGDLSFLKQMVSISSGTGDEKGVYAVQTLVAAQLKILGFTAMWKESASPKEFPGKMLIAEKKGEVSKFLTLVTHADTVFETLNPFTLSSDGKKALGSGVIDNKGGITVGIATLRKFLTHPSHHYSLRFVVSPSEETGSKGFADAFQKLSSDSVFLIGLEPGLKNGNYVASRKGVRWYDIVVTGKEAHAGVDHKDGVNACLDLAIKISNLQALTDYDKGNTVSIGRIDGGKDKFNIVCGRAQAKIDTRFVSAETGKELSLKIEKILKSSNVKSYAKQEETTTIFTNPVDTAALSPSKESALLMKDYEKNIQELEQIQIEGEASGGVADLNQMSRSGALIADGMGPLGGGVHTRDEFLTIDSLRTRSEALSRFLRNFDQKKMEK